MWLKPCRTFHPWCPCIKTRCLSPMICQLNGCPHFLYARLKNGTYYAVAMSVRPSVCPSVRPSVRVFRTFLQHALRYQFETWYIHSVGGTTCRVWVASQLGHFDLVSSQKEVKPIFCNHGLINQDKFFKFGTQVACCILLDISSVFL